MPRVVHFEMQADDPERASRFYGEVFGWQFRKWDGPSDYWLVVTGEGSIGINGGLSRRNPMGQTNTIDVPSVDEATSKIVAAGGEVVVPKMPIPGVGHLAYAKDSEGNLFGIIEFDRSSRAEAG